MRVALDPELGDRSIKRALAGPFRLVSRSDDRVVIRRPGLTVVFRRLEPYAALQAFRRGELDEAPVPQGEIRALEAHPTLSPALRARALQGIDVVVLPRGLSPALRRVYRLTVPRGEYQALISERVAAPAYGLRPGAEPTSPAEARAARGSIRGLSPSPLTLGVADRPELVEAAELVWAEWRQLGLPIRLRPGARHRGHALRPRDPQQCARRSTRRRRPARLGRRSSPRLTASPRLANGRARRRRLLARVSRSALAGGRADG